MSPELSVVVTSGNGAGALERTLHSLAAQTLDPSRFEIVVAGPERPATLGPRHVLAVDAAPAVARDRGLAAATGAYSTVLAAGDTVSAGYLHALLAVAAPDAVGAAWVVTPDDLADPAPDTPLARALGAQPAADASADTDAETDAAAGPGEDALVAVLAGLSGTVFPTAAARDAGAGTPPDAVLLARLGLPVVVVAASADAFCYRAAIPEVDVGAELDTAAQLVAELGDTPLARAGVAARADALNRVLRGHPDRHGELVERVRARGLPFFDWARLNRGVACDLAIVYAALPFVDTAGNIAARRVRETARPVDVLCADLTGRVRVDDSASVLWQEYVDEVHALPVRVTFEGDWEPIAAFCRRGLDAIAAAEAVKGRYRSVYSRTMFPAAQLLGALHKARHPDTPWLAEFSDPQQRDSRGSVRRSTGVPDAGIVAELSAAVTAAGFTPPPTDTSVWEWGELAAYALADTVLFTNEHQRDYMLGYCADRAYAERAATHAVVAHHPQPPAELYRADGATPEPGVVHVGYFGTFYPTRTITEVVDALALLDRATRARLRLHVFTKHPEQLRVAAHAAGLDDVLVVEGYLGFTEYLARTTRMDVLIVGDYRTAGGVHDLNPYLPAKYADYAGSGRRIWGLVEPGSVLDGLPLDHRSALGDVAGARAVLEEIAALG